jgi:MYXO-CTERM domain-containing protein
MRSRGQIACVLVALVAVGTTGWSSDAHACGGCIHGEPPPDTPPENASVVTDHRMVLVLDAASTTLYDQVEYSGNPGDFAWVLPVRGEVVVGVGSDAFVDSLDVVTSPIIHAPTPNCPNVNYSGYSGGGGGGGGGCGGSSGDSGSGLSFGDPSSGGYVDAGATTDDTGVTVRDRETVGPYDVVQVHGTDEGSIVGWLRSHSYVVPADIEPMLTKYVSEGFDFVAVRLHPDVGVQAMRPIRVSFPGALSSLPLRMVAAGVGNQVGLKLFVVGDGRWRTANFPSFLITPSELTWDFDLERSDYTAVRQQIADVFDGRAFALEASMDLSAGVLPPVTPDAGGPDAFHVDAHVDAHPDVESESEAEAEVSEVADAATETDADLDSDLDSDLDADLDSDLDAGIDTSPMPDTAPAADTTPAADTAPSADADAGPVPGIDPTTSDRDIVFGTHTYRRFTRLRADLPSKYLDVDLVLEADVSQLAVPHDYLVKASVNDSAACPASPPQGRTGSDGGLGCACETEPSGSPTNPVIAAGLAIAFASIVRASRRRRPRAR